MNYSENIAAAFEALGGIIRKNKDEIFFKDIQIKDLEEKLEVALKELESVKNAHISNYKGE